MVALALRNDFIGRGFVKREVSASTSSRGCKVREGRGMAEQN